MEDIKKVAILGAGAMGAYFASRFFDTAAFSTVLIAKGQRLDKLKTKGLVVNGESYAIPVIHPDVACFDSGSHYRRPETSSSRGSSSRFGKTCRRFNHHYICYEWS